MFTQEKFYKRENLDQGAQANMAASAYDSHVGIRVSSPSLGGLRMQMTAEEAEILAAQLLRAAERIRKNHA